MNRYLLVALGGGLGSVARFWVGSTMGTRLVMRFPLGTLLVNLSACLVIGFVLTWLGEHLDINPAWRYFFVIGFVGAYSTFSTFEWETIVTMRSGTVWLAALYAFGSVVAGLVAIVCGSALAKAL